MLVSLFYTCTIRTSSTINLGDRAFDAADWEPSSALVTLVNPVTGENTPDPPRSYSEVQRLDADESGALLRAPNLRGARNAEQKRSDISARLASPNLLAVSVFSRSPRSGIEFGVTRSREQYPFVVAYQF